MSFATPAAPGGGFNAADNEGALLLIQALEIVSDIPTSYGDTDAIRANVAVLDGTNKGDTYPDSLIFPRVLQSQLRPNIGGDQVLGRLGKGTAKPGQSAPWRLDDPTPDDVTTAEKYVAYIATQAEADEAPF